MYRRFQTDFVHGIDSSQNLVNSLFSQQAGSISSIKTTPSLTQKSFFIGSPTPQTAHWVKPTSGRSQASTQQTPPLLKAKSFFIPSQNSVSGGSQSIQSQAKLPPGKSFTEKKQPLPPTPAFKVSFSWNFDLHLLWTVIRLTRNHPQNHACSFSPTNQVALKGLQHLPSWRRSPKILKRRTQQQARTHQRRTVFWILVSPPLRWVYFVHLD